MTSITSALTVPKLFEYTPVVFDNQLFPYSCDRPCSLFLALQQLNSHHWLSICFHHTLLILVQTHMLIQHACRCSTELGTMHLQTLFLLSCVEGGSTFGVWPMSWVGQTDMKVGNKRMTHSPTRWWLIQCCCASRRSWWTHSCCWCTEILFISCNKSK